MGVSGLCLADSRDPEGEKSMYKDLGKEKKHNYGAPPNLEGVFKYLVFCFFFQTKVSVFQAILELEAIFLPWLTHHA